MATTSNLVVLNGTITNDATERELRSGGVVAEFDVRTRLDGEAIGSVPGPAPSTADVPVVWHDPRPADVAYLVRDAEVVVVGTVRRRFFRGAGGVQSRTEVIVDRVVPARRRKTVASVIAAASARLSADCG